MLRLGFTFSRSFPGLSRRRLSALRHLLVHDVADRSIGSEDHGSRRAIFNRVDGSGGIAAAGGCVRPRARVSALEHRERRRVSGLVEEVAQFDAGQRDAAQQAVSWLRERSLFVPAEEVVRIS